MLEKGYTTKEEVRNDIYCDQTELVVEMVLVIDDEDDCPNCTVETFLEKGSEWVYGDPLIDEAVEKQDVNWICIAPQLGRELAKTERVAVLEVGVYGCWAGIKKDVPNLNDYIEQLVL